MIIIRALLLFLKLAAFALVSFSIAALLYSAFMVVTN